MGTGASEGFVPPAMTNSSEYLDRITKFVVAGSVLSGTHLCVGQYRRGKVRDVYTLHHEDKVIIVTTDRLSAFDRVLCKVPFKGAVLNTVAAWWFARTAHICPNHLVDVPHPNVTIARKTRPLPIEFVVRAYMTGSTSTSLWTHYKAGALEYCGNKLPQGLRKNDKLPEPIITPTTKEDEHDRPIDPKEIVGEGWYVPSRPWQRPPLASDSVGVSARCTAKIRTTPCLTGCLRRCGRSVGTTPLRYSGMVKRLRQVLA